MSDTIISELTPPKSFAYYNGRIIRGRYPDTAAVNFITKLGVRKFVSLGVGFPGIPERNLGKVNKIELTHYPMSIGDYAETGPHVEKQLTDVINYILVKNSGSKIYIYDDDGFTMVGVVCAILRRIEGWDTMSAIAECARFFPGGNFDIDTARMITNFDIAEWR